MLSAPLFCPPLEGAGECERLIYLRRSATPPPAEDMKRYLLNFGIKKGREPALFTAFLFKILSVLRGEQTSP